MNVVLFIFVMSVIWDIARNENRGQLNLTVRLQAVASNFLQTGSWRKTHAQQDKIYTICEVIKFVAIILCCNVMCCSKNIYEIEERKFCLFCFPCKKKIGSFCPVLTIRASLMRKIHLSVYPNEKEANGFSVR